MDQTESATGPLASLSDESLEALVKATGDVDGLPGRAEYLAELQRRKDVKQAGKPLDQQARLWTSWACRHPSLRQGAT